MRVLKIYEETQVVIAEIEVKLGEEVRSAPTLCARYNGKIIPLNTPDGRPVLMTLDNQIKND
ncbi:MAG: hypothetical protein VXY05_08360 [Pseudomonadota bacterium]|jgi:hypothetical protein|nr:hypothetical protein [Pseudomonadota bacterium]